MPTKTPTKRKLQPQRAPLKAKKTLRKTKPKSKSEWNILCYFAGDGLLSATMISQLKELTDAGFQEDTNVLAYFDPNCNGRNARIFDVNAVRKEDKPKTMIGDREDSFVRNIAEDCHVPGLPQIPAAITLRYFLEYARAYYPAKNYMLFLMGHGVIVGNDSFLPDPDDNSAITLVDLGWILRTFASKVRDGDDEFHLVGFHSCSMSSVELAYELAGSARYMIGTQGAAFPGSWPYRQLLKKILSSIDKSRKGQLQRSDRGVIDQDVLVDSILYGLQDLSFYNSADFWLAGFSADLSLCRLDVETVGKLSKPIKALSKALKGGLALKEKDPSPTNYIRLAHLESQSYWNENYTDLYDFCRCLSKRCNGKTKGEIAIKRACNRVTAALRKGGRDEAIVAYSDYYGPAYQYSHGLSIYFPWRRPKETVIESYQRNKFTQEHLPDSWLSFLEEYFYATQRDARRTRRPEGWVAEVRPRMRWRTEDNLLEILSDKRLLSLGPPPRVVGGGALRVGADLSSVGEDLLRLGGYLKKMSGCLDGKCGDELSQACGDLSKIGGDLSKVGGDLAGKIGGDLSKVGDDLSKFLSEDLSKVGGDLSRVGREMVRVADDLPGKFGGDLSKIGGDLSTVGKHLTGEEFGNLSKIGGDLSKLLGGLSKVGGDLSKIGGDLSKIGGDLAGKIGGDLAGKIGADLASKIGGDLAGKIGADLASKIGGDLASKIGGDLAGKIGGDLASKIGGDLAGKIGGDLAGKIGGDLAGKIGGDLGGFYGHTVIKNFEAPEDKFVTSRWYIGDTTSTSTNGSRKRGRSRKANKK